MAEEFTPVLPKYPMTPRQFAEQEELLNNDEYVGQLSLNQLMQLRAQRKQYHEAQAAQTKRFQEMGLSQNQIDYLNKAALETDADPNDPEMRAQMLQEFDRDMAGVLEGAKQAVEGVADFAMDLSNGLHTLTRGVIGDDDAAKQAWKDSVSERRMNSAEEHIQTFGQLPGNLPVVVGQIAPWIAASPGKANNFTRFIMRNTFLGGIGGASQYLPEEAELADRWSSIAWGAGIGTGVGTLFGAYPFIKRAGARGLIRRFNEADSLQREEVERLTQEMTGNPEFRFDAAQITGARFWANLLVGTADKATHAQQVNNTNILVNHLLDLAKTTPDGAARGAFRTPEQLAAQVRVTLKAVHDNLYAAATGNWGRTSQAIIETYGDDAVLRGRDYLFKIDQIIDQETNALTNMGGKPTKKLLKYREEVDIIVNPNVVQVENAGTKNWKVYVFDRKTGERGHRVLAQTEQEARMQAQRMAFDANEAIGGPTVEETFKILNGLNRLIGGDAPIFKNVAPGTNRNIGRAFMGAFTADMEASASNKGAVQAINSLRNMYKADMAAIQAVDDTVLNAVFGGTKWRKNVPAAFDRVLAQEPSAMVQTRRLLEENDPELLDQLRRYALRRAVSKGEQPPGAGEIEGQYNIQKLADALADTRGRTGMFASGLWDGATAVEIKQTADALRILANKQFTGIIPGGTKPEEWTINLISRNPAFFGRFVTRMFSTGESLEVAVLNPEWRHAVRVIADDGLRNSAKGRAALFYLTDLMAETEERRRVEIAAAEEQRKAEAMRVAP